MPHLCIAREWYEKTRHLCAFSVQGATKVRKNQHGTYYTFQDGSVFSVYGFGIYSYRGTDGLMYARRTEYGNMPPVEFDQSSLKLLGVR